MSSPLYHIQLPKEWLQEQTEYSAPPPDPQAQRVVPAVDFPISAPTAETSGPDSAKEPGNILRPGFESDIPDTGPNMESSPSGIDPEPASNSPRSTISAIHTTSAPLNFTFSPIPAIPSIAPADNIRRPNSKNTRNKFRSGSPNRYGKYLRPMPICAPLISRHLQLLEIRPIRTIRPSIHPMLPAFRPPPSPATKSKNFSTANFLP